MHAASCLQPRHALMDTPGDPLGAEIKAFWTVSADLGSDNELIPREPLQCPAENLGMQRDACR